MIVVFAFSFVFRNQKSEVIELGPGSVITESGVKFPVEPWSRCQFSLNLKLFEAYFIRRRVHN